MSKEIKTKPLRGEKRRAELVDIAARAFVELGYANTTTDEIVRRAKASKTTVYRHFKNKESIFAEIIDNLSSRTLHSVDSHVLGPNSDLDDLRALLLVFGKSMIALISDELAVGLWRSLIGEGFRIRETAETFFRHGPESATDYLARQLTTANDAGLVSIDDAKVSAALFMGMLRGDDHLSLLLGLTPPPTEDEIARRAALCAETFLNGIRAGR